eukprot:XP_028344169.1 uncharacterized protein LOC114486105 [Physeter catodon]
MRTSSSTVFLYHQQYCTIAPTAAALLLSGANFSQLSNRSGAGLTRLINAVGKEAIRRKRTVYVIGAANAGKTSFLNNLLSRASGTGPLVPRNKPKAKGETKAIAAACAVPGTTLDFLPVVIDNRWKVVDTPGIFLRGSYPIMLSQEELQVAVPSSSLHRISLRIEENEGVWLGSLARVELLKGRGCFISSSTTSIPGNATTVQSTGSSAPPRSLRSSPSSSLTTGEEEVTGEGRINNRSGVWVPTAVEEDTLSGHREIMEKEASSRANDNEEEYGDIFDLTIEGQPLATEESKDALNFSDVGDEGTEPTPLPQAFGSSVYSQDSPMPVVEAIPSLSTKTSRGRGNLLTNQPLYSPLLKVQMAFIPKLPASWFAAPAAAAEGVNDDEKAATEKGKHQAAPQGPQQQQRKGVEGDVSAPTPDTAETFPHASSIEGTETSKQQLEGLQPQTQQQQAAISMTFLGTETILGGIKMWAHSRRVGVAPPLHESSHLRRKYETFVRRLVNVKQDMGDQKLELMSFRDRFSLMRSVMYEQNAASRLMQHRGPFYVKFYPAKVSGPVPFQVDGEFFLGHNVVGAEVKYEKTFYVLKQTDKRSPMFRVTNILDAFTSGEKGLTEVDQRLFYRNGM